MDADELNGMLTTGIEMMRMIRDNDPHTDDPMAAKIWSKVVNEWQEN